jgi:uncharacterized protein (TIGR00369 family)
VPDVEKRGNFVRDAWNRLGSLPRGKRIFSRLVGTAAPYTGSIGGRVVELRENYSRVEMRDRRAVRNHLRSVHAVALVNLAELTGNVAVAYTLPDDARFIVAGLSIDYIKKARGTITGICDQELPHTSERAEYEIEVNMFDADGDVVARAVLRTLVGPKKDN